MPLEVTVAQTPEHTELPVAVTVGPAVQLVMVIIFVTVARQPPLDT